MLQYWVGIAFNTETGRKFLHRHTAVARLLLPSPLASSPLTLSLIAFSLRVTIAHFLSNHCARLNESYAETCT